MTQIFTGSGLGTHSSSLGLGSYGPKGVAALGQGGDSVYVNAANGNLVIQQTDGFLADMGIGISLMQTYNSKGDINSSWRFNVQSRIEVQGQANTAGSIVIRTAEDGHRSSFHYDVTKQRYLPDEGGTERITFSQGKWLYKKGDSKAVDYYNQDGQLIKMADKDGHYFSFSYINGALSSITDKSGKQTITWSFEQGLLTDVTVTSQGQVIHHVHYEYNEQQQLHKVSRDLGQGKVYWTTYDYVPDSQLIRDINQSDGTSLHIDYDAQGRVKQLIDGEGRKSIYSYAEGQTSVTNNLGEIWTYSYDENNRLTAVDGPEQYHIRYYYEGNQLSSIVQGSELWRFCYNEQGDCIRIEEPTGQITQRVYDAEHRLILESNYQNFDGTHHPIDKRTTRYIHDELGHLLFVIGSDGTVTEHRYDREGQRINSRTYLHGTYNLKEVLSDKLLSQAELVAWVAQQTPKDVSLIGYNYDWRGQLIEELHYAAVDGQGQGMSAGVLSAHYRYDAAGRLVEKSVPTDKGWSSTQYRYDDLGRLIETIDNQNHRQKIEYDDMHQRIIQTDANGLQTIKLYDKSGLLLSVIRLDSQKNYGKTQYQYDGVGRLIAETDVHGLTTYRFYNHLGQLQGLINTLGQVTEYCYNSDGLLIKIHQFQQTISTEHWLEHIPQWTDINPSFNSKDRIEQIIYNQYNQIAYRINTEGCMIGYQYNARGQLISSVAYAKRLENYNPDHIVTLDQLPIATDATDRKNIYYYDSQERLQAKIDSEGYAIEYFYDLLGNVIEVCKYAKAQASPLTGFWLTDKPKSQEQDIHAYSFYDARGLKIGEIDGEGYVVEYRYNDSGLVQEICAYEQRIDSKTLARERDFEHFIPQSQSNDHHTYYQYDDLNHVSAERKQNGLITTYTYNETGKVSSKTLMDAKTFKTRQQLYRYDAMGRLIQSLDELGAALLSKTVLTDEEIEALWQAHSIIYEYNEAGLLKSTINALQQKTQYWYDDYVRLQYTIHADGAVEEYQYTAFNQIASVKKYSAVLKVKTDALTTEELKKVIDVLASSSQDELVHYEYNTLGQIIAQHSGSKGLTSSEYNAFGELERSIQKIDANHNRMTTYEYDKRGLLIHSRDDLGGAEKNKTIAYDAFGWLDHQIDGRGNRREFLFNKRGEQTLIFKESSYTTGLFKLITYDAFGRVLEETNLARLRNNLIMRM
jgi:YD repeat-containing protein